MEFGPHTLGWVLNTIRELDLVLSITEFNTEPDLNENSYNKSLQHWIRKMFEVQEEWIKKYGVYVLTRPAIQKLTKPLQFFENMRDIMLRFPNDDQYYENDISNSLINDSNMESII